MNYNYTFLLGWRAQLSTRKIFLSYRTRNISNTYMLFFPTFILFNLTLCFPPLICFKLFPALLDWYEWSSTTFLSSAPCAFRFSTFLQSAWRRYLISQTSHHNRVYWSLFHHQTLLQHGIWHLSYVFLSPQVHLCEVFLLQQAYFKDHCPGVPCNVLHLT